MTQATVLYHRQRASKTRKEILRTSMDIASAEGLEGLSIGRLATELQMSKTGIFAHFGRRNSYSWLRSKPQSKSSWSRWYSLRSRTQGVFRVCVQCWRTGLGTLRGSFFAAVVSSPPHLLSSTVAPVVFETKSPALPRHG